MSEYKGASLNHILAIDPGESGSIAWTDDGCVHAEPMPDGMTAIIDRLRELFVSNPELVATVERVGGYMPGNSGPASVKFARHCGNIDAALYCLGIPTNPPNGVAPQTWMKSMGALPKDKAERKRAIRDAMARRFPHLRVTLKTADALGILCYMQKQ